MNLRLNRYGPDYMSTYRFLGASGKGSCGGSLAKSGLIPFPNPRYVENSGKPALSARDIRF